MSFTVVIPARYASTRLPHKPLRDIGGKPMIQHVYECAQQSSASEIVVATDDQRIADVVTAFGGQVCMTSAEHKTGSDRLEEVVRLKRFNDSHIVVNLQGDEPLMPPAVIDQVAANLAYHAHASAATVCTRIHTAKELFDPHAVKVVTDEKGFALYFSRAPIPWDRDKFPVDYTDVIGRPRRERAVDNTELPEGTKHFRHIGLYAYRAGFLRRFVQWPQCYLEKVESLEQLRVLWQGEKIHVDEAVEVPGQGVDTPHDLEHVTRIILARQKANRA